MDIEAGEEKEEEKAEKEAQDENVYGYTTSMNK